MFKTHSDLAKRNGRICAYYAAGHDLDATANEFGLSQQRVRQILQHGKVWRPFVRSGRSAFLGVSIAEAQKEALKAEAERRSVEAGRHVSVSEVVAETLDETLRAKP